MVSGLVALVYAGAFESDKDYGWHCHGNLEFVFLREGRCDAIANRTLLPGSPGTIHVYPPNTLHMQKTHTLTNGVVIGLQCPDHIFSNAFRTISVDPNGCQARWFDDLVRLHREMADAGAQVASNLLMTLLEYLKVVEDRITLSQSLHPSVARAIEFIDRHYMQGITVDQIADYANCSASHLMSLFRTRFGCGPIGYQQNLRLRYAEKMLLAPYTTVNEVAQACGYSETSYFIRLFRRTYGLSPEKWRLQKRQVVQKLQSSASIV